MSDRPIRVLVVDDHPIVRDGLRVLLESVGDFEVVGEAGDGLAAVDAAEQHRPDVVIMDLQISGISGVEATERITRALPETGVLVITMFEDDASVFAALRAGALGYLVKGANQQEILRAINAVASREALLGHTLAQRVLRHVSDDRPSQRRPFPELTERELEILDLIAAGANNAAIAEQLGITGKTVANHISNVFAKLEVVDRSQAIVRAREAGFGQAHNRSNRAGAGGKMAGQA